MKRREFITLLGVSKPYVGTKNLLLCIANISSVFAVIASCGLSPARAHDWYPHECCHGGDCAPVDNVTRIVMAASGETGDRPSGRWTCPCSVHSPGLGLVESRRSLARLCCLQIFRCKNRKIIACMYACVQACTEEWVSLAYSCHRACIETH
jgi:hypothetical protein